MLSRIQKLRERHAPLRQFEVDTPLTINECLMRLTGRHPPFGSKERIARPHPFQGKVDSDSITITITPPYRLTGGISRCENQTQLALRLVYVESSAAGDVTSFSGVLIFAMYAYLAYPLIGAIVLRESVPSYVVTTALAITTVLTFAWLTDRYVLHPRRVVKFGASAPDVAPMVQILSKIVLATEVREFSVTGKASDDRVIEPEGRPG